MEKHTNYFFYWLSPMLGGFFIWIYQTYDWLRYDEWNSFSLLWPLSFFENFRNWVYYPSDWFGLHDFFDFIPFSVVLILVGVLIIYLEESQNSQTEYEAYSLKMSGEKEE